MVAFFENQPPDPTWRVFPSRAEAWHAAFGLKRDLLWIESSSDRDVMEDAFAAVWFATWRLISGGDWVVLWNVMGANARDLVWEAVWNAASDAARDAVIPAHWMVWERGYGCLGRFDGVLFVYEHP